MRCILIVWIHTIIMMSRNVNSLVRSAGLTVLSKRRIHNGKIFKFRTMSTSTDTAADIDAMKSKLNNLISSTARGTNDNNKQEITVVVESFEASKIQNQSVFPLQDLIGTWELLYTNDDITRSSPFFWAFKKALRDVEDPLKIVGPKMLSDSIFKVTDSIPFKSIGDATQQFTMENNLSEGESIRGTLKSSMEIKVAVVGSSQMTTSSRWRTTEESDLLEIEVEKTEVLGSSIASLLNPLIKMIPGDIADKFSSFPSGAALELVKPGSSTVYMRIVHLDSTMRIVKNEADGKFFVYGKSY